MNDPVEIMRDIERFYNPRRPCKLINAQNTVKDDDDIMLVVYELDLPDPRDIKDNMLTRRWAVYVNGRLSGGGEVSTHFTKAT